MIEISCYVDEKRFDEYKAFIRTLPSVRFISNPYKTGNRYRINISLTSEDSNRLSEKENEWYQLDNPKPIKKKSFIKKLFLRIRQFF